MNDKKMIYSALRREINNVRAWGLRPRDFWNEEKIEAVGNALIYWLKAKPQNIWFKGFLHSYGISSKLSSTLYNNFPLFREYYDIAKTIQEAKLVEYSASRNLDGNFCKFVLSNHHSDWKEKVSVELDVNVNAFSSVLANVSQSQSRLPQLTQDAITMIECEAVKPRIESVIASDCEDEARQVLGLDGRSAN